MDDFSSFCWLVCLCQYVVMGHLFADNAEFVALLNRQSLSNLMLLTAYAPSADSRLESSRSRALLLLLLAARPRGTFSS